MRVISLQPIPNQVTTAVAQDNEYTVEIRYFRNLMYATIRLETGEVVIGAVRCANLQWLLPWRRPGYGDGNFRFEDDNGQYPDYVNFGKTCRLVYYTASEIADMEG